MTDRHHDRDVHGDDPNPYQPPAGARPDVSAETGELRPLGVHGKLLLGLLGAWAVMNGLVLAAATRQLSLLARFAAGRYHEPEVLANAARMQVASFGRLVVTAALAAAFAAFFVRATKNHRARHAPSEPPRGWARPGAVVAGCFVPVLNLVAPWVIARRVAGGRAVHVWWLAFLATVGLETASRLVGGAHPALEHLVLATRLQVFATLTGFASVAAAVAAARAVLADQAAG